MRATLLDDEPRHLGDLVDAAALEELCASVERLFGVPLRVVGVGDDEPVTASPSPEVTLDVSDVEHDGRVIARVVLGPYVADGGQEIDAEAPWVRAKPTAIARIAEHVRSTLGLLLASGYKVFLTSRLHLASVREAGRDLSAKAAELDEALSRLDELERLKASFLATVSHELRTPLTSIIGYSEMLAEGIGGTLTDEQQDFVQTVRSKSLQLLDLIVKLLDLSKLEGGAATPLFAEVPLADVAAEVMTSLAASASKKGVSLDLEREAESPVVMADRERLRQIVRHLVENAIKFTEPGGDVRVSVRVVTDANADEVGHAILAPVRRAAELRVCDTGRGVPEPERTRIFDPFYQVDQSSTREHGGAGLGLAIVRRLVEAHAGAVRVEPNDPRGAVFVVQLPLARGRAAH
jgi:signal transduction histidine kinase